MNKTITHFILAACAMTVASAAKADFTPTRISATDTLVVDQRANDKTYAIQFGYSAALAGGQAFVGAGAGAAVGADKGSHTVYVYDIDENGATTLSQKIVEPEPANFFGWAIAASDKYLAVYASGTKKLYVYEKQLDGKWTSEPVITTGELSNYYFALDGDRLVVTENNVVSIQKITKAGEDSYTLEKEVIAEGELKVENQNAININPNAGVAISGNNLLINKKNDGAYFFEYTESGWTQTKKVDNTGFAANRYKTVAISDKYASIATGDKSFLVVEKTADGWANAEPISLQTQNIRKPVTTVINGNFIVVTETAGTSTAVNDYYAEFYTKVDGEWTFVKYAAQLNVPSGIAMDCDFDGQYYLASANTTVVNDVANVGKAYLYNFITDIDYTIVEPKDLDYNGEPQTPTLKVNVAKEYNANVTYSTTADGVYTAELPSYTEAGEYTLFYKIEAEGYSTIVESVTFNVDQVKPLVVTAACEVEFAKAQVRAEGKNVIVENAVEKSINVYNIAGSLVYSKASAGAKEVIALDKSGIYIVEVNGTASKVVVK